MRVGIFIGLVCLGLGAFQVHAEEHEQGNRTSRHIADNDDNGIPLLSRLKFSDEEVEELQDGLKELTQQADTVRFKSVDDFLTRFAVEKRMRWLKSHGISNGASFITSLHLDPTSRAAKLIAIDFEARLRAEQQPSLTLALAKRIKRNKITRMSQIATLYAAYRIEKRFKPLESFYQRAGLAPADAKSEWLRLQGYLRRTSLFRERRNTKEANNEADKALKLTLHWWNAIPDNDLVTMDQRITLLRKKHPNEASIQFIANAFSLMKGGETTANHKVPTYLVKSFERIVPTDRTMTTTATGGVNGPRHGSPRRMGFLRRLFRNWRQHRYYNYVDRCLNDPSIPDGTAVSVVSSLLGNMQYQGQPIRIEKKDHHFIISFDLALIYKGVRPQMKTILQEKLEEEKEQISEFLVPYGIELRMNFVHDPQPIPYNMGRTFVYEKQYSPKADSANWGRRNRGPYDEDTNAIRTHTHEVMHYLGLGDEYDVASGIASNTDSVMGNPFHPRTRLYESHLMKILGPLCGRRGALR